MSSPNRNWPPIDLIVVTRGGGSIEDLWEFNEEIVARAIFHSAIPVVSAIGHEIDFTIADFVADLRAPTPSAAAELIVPDVAEVRRRVDELAVCLNRCLLNFLSHQQTRLRFLSERTLARELIKRMRDAQQQLDLTRETLRRGVAQDLSDTRAAWRTFANALKSHNPERELVARRASFIDLHRRFAALRSSCLENPRSVSIGWRRFCAFSVRKRHLAAATASRPTAREISCAQSRGPSENENSDAGERWRI